MKYKILKGKLGLKVLSEKSDNTQVNNIRRPVQKIKYNYVPMSYSNRMKLQAQKYKDDNSLFSGSRLLDRTKELGKVIKTPAATLAASTAAVTSPAIAGKLLTGATSAVGFGQLGMGSGNAVDDAFYGASGEFIGPIAGKAIGNGINATKKKLVPAIKNIKTNYKDLNELRDFASTYGYQKPITNIFSNKSVDKTFKNLLNQHNTFTRGVSVNDVALSNPQILQSLKNNGIYNPDIDKIIPKKKIGEYMATHIPGDTGGYGRFGLDSGDNGLYTSNSYETAKAYTYGDGYVATLRRPVNYNSPSRSNWIKNADFDASSLNDYGLVFKTDRDNIIENRLKHKNDFGKNLKIRYKNLREWVQNRYPDKYPTPFEKVNVYEWTGLNPKLQNKFKNFENLIIKTIDKRNVKLNTYKKNIYRDLPQDIKFGEESSQKPIHSTWFGPKYDTNQYQHFIFRGNPGDKPLDLINLTRFKAHNVELSRAHEGTPSKGLSRKSFNRSDVLKYVPDPWDIINPF